MPDLPRHPRRRLAAWLPVLFLAGVAHGGDFTHFESSHVHPLALSAAGDALYAVNTPEARLAIFDVQAGGALAFRGDVPVGLEPVSLAVRPDRPEVWVVNHLSDSVSVVDVAARRLVATIAVGDEPTDVVFARGRAFVSLAGVNDRVAVVDAETRELTHYLDIFGDDPRALAVTPDGARVALVVLESGNRTTVVHPTVVRNAGGPPLPDPPRDPALPGEAPDEGLIVQLDLASGRWLDETGGDWSALLDYTLPDRDLFWIDAAADTPQVVATARGVGTTLFDVALHPVSGEAWVPNTEARNLVRFEPNLRGHLVETRVSRVDPDSGAVDPVDLNPHIDYRVSPGPPGEREQSLAQPGQGVFDAAGERYYLAAFGSAKVAVLDANSGAVLQRIAVPGGPSGLALHEATGTLYVLSRFEHRISVVDLAAGAEVASLGVAGPAGFDPSPPEVREGRRLLYDAAESSGHGDLSCATCHVFANFDGLAWDLGDPRGDFLFYADADWVTFAPAPTSKLGFDPMKGPIVTQTLRGLRGHEPFHWRGDRRNFQHFNGAFVSLLGRGETLTDAQMDAFAAFAMTVQFPPNPNRRLDDSLRNQLDLPHFTPTSGSPRNGKIVFETVPIIGGGTCRLCHAFPAGTTNALTESVGSQDTKIAHLRNVYEKVGFDPMRLQPADPLIGNDAAFEQKAGVSVLHGGSLSLIEFLRVSFLFEGQTLGDIVAFLHSFPTGTFPCVGHQLTLDGADSQTPESMATLATLMAEAEAGHCDLVAKGVIDEADVGFVYDAAQSAFVSDSERDPVGLADFGADDILTFSGVPEGNGRRLGIDRDRDTCLDRDEAAVGSDPAHPGALRDDADADGIPDELDRCPGFVQRDHAQPDRDGNGRPDACECGDVSGDGRVDVRDLRLLARWLFGTRPRGFAPQMCNVQGAPGNRDTECSWRDFTALRRHLARPKRRRALLPDACRPTDPLPLPTPQTCYDGAPL